VRMTLWFEVKFRKVVPIATALLAALACMASPICAQSYRGSIRGQIVDASGAAVAGASITAKSQATGESRSVPSDAEGGYVITELQAGEYEVTAAAKGLVPVEQKASVVVGRETTLNFTLGKVTPSSQTVIVNQEATPLLETTQDVLGGTVEQQLVAELPLNGRDFGKLVALVPGVIVEGSGVAGTEKGFGQFNINGSRDRSNNYTLDGTDNNDPWFNNSALNQVGITGAPASLLPVDAIQEFNLLSQFPAEYGRNSGGVVNIITKSGTNDFHGSAFEYARNSFWDARNYFNPVSNPQTRFINNQFGGSIGGPIIHDKTFFFGAYEGQRERVGSDFTTRVQIVSASFLSTLSPTRINELRFGYTRFRNSFTSQDAVNPKSGLPDFGTGLPGLPEIDFGGLIENLGATAFSVPRARISQNYQILDNSTWIKGAHTLKFGGEYRRAWVSAFNDNLGRGLIQFGPTGLDPADPVVDTLANFYLGAFCDPTGTTCPGFAEGNIGNTQRTTSNNGLAFFAQDEFRVRRNLTVTYGLRWEYFGPVSEKNNLLFNFPGPFSASSQLVRVGTNGLSGAYKRDLNNFGPRLAVAWNPFQNTVIRAGYGIYYDYIPQDLMIANFTTVAGIATNPVGPQSVLPLSFNQDPWNGTASGPVFTPVTSGPFPIFVTTHNLATPYVGEWNLNIQEQISRGAAIEIGYVGSKGTRLTRLYDANQDGINPNYGEIDTFATNSASTYNALQVQARFSDWHRFSGFSAYVFSKSLDGASDGIDFNFATAAFPQNSDNLQAEKGPSTFDARHRWTTALTYAVPVWDALPPRLAEGWRWNTIVTVMSGQPIGIITPNGIFNADNSDNFHQRPDVVPGVNQILGGNPANGYINPLAFATPAGNFGDLGRDAVYGPGFWNVDFSLTKDTKLTERLTLQLRAEFFNIFNHPQFALPGGVITPAAGSGLTLQQALAQCPGCFSTQTPDVAQGNPGLGGGGPRVLQFAARLQF